MNYYDIAKYAEKKEVTSTSFQFHHEEIARIVPYNLSYESLRNADFSKFAEYNDLDIYIDSKHQTLDYSIFFYDGEFLFSVGNTYNNIIHCNKELLTKVITEMNELYGAVKINYDWRNVEITPYEYSYAASERVKDECLVYNTKTKKYRYYEEQGHVKYGDNKHYIYGEHDYLQFLKNDLEGKDIVKLNESEFRRNMFKNTFNDFYGRNMLLKYADDLKMDLNMEDKILDIFD